MSNNLDYLAKHVRSLILEVEKLGYVFNDIHDAYVKEEEELDDLDHPVAKLQMSDYAISKAVDAVAKTLVADNLMDPHFRRALQKLATMDAMRDGNTDFVRFVRKHIEDKTD